MPLSPPNSTAKANLRRALRARRNALSDAQRDEFSARITAHLKTWLLSLEPSPSIVALYEALPPEVDLNDLRALPFEWVVPRFVEGKWIDADETEAFEAVQVLAPPIAPARIDLFLVPSLAFDAAGNRLGQGGGWYDRVLSRAPHALKIGVAFDCQIIESVPYQAHDVKMDGVVTENGWCKYLQR